MPNNVTNHLLVEGSPNEVARFFAQAKGEKSDFDFNNFVPMPGDVFQGNLGQEERQQYPGEKNWYDWSIANWGTKWNAYDVCVNPPIARFDTAWGVPVALLVAASKIFPELTFTNEWIEETLESAGILVIKAGQVESDRSESCSAWNAKASEFIHPLNMKYNRDSYVSYLEECQEDECPHSAYAFHLKLAQA